MKTMMMMLRKNKKCVGMIAAIVIVVLSVAIIVPLLLSSRKRSSDGEDKDIDEVVDLWPSLVSLGAYHSCGLFEGDTFKCWGLNDWGQLGDGTNTTRQTPTTIDFGEGLHVVAFDLGGWHTCVILNDDTLNCFGRNFYGQLGDGTSTKRYTPTPVIFDDDDSASNLHAVVIALGLSHTCAILNDDTLRCWGHNSDGQLGDGTISRNRYTPTIVNFDSYSVGTASQESTHAISIALGFHYTCAIMNDNSLRCWGHNGLGQLGIGSTDDKYTPSTHVDFGPSLYAVTISAGAYHMCAILNDNTLRCWGYNVYGQLGDGTATKKDIPTTINVDPDLYPMAIASGRDHTCAILNNGLLKCWGNYRFINIFTPTAVVGIPDASDVVDIALGMYHSCAVINDGSLRCWGRNNNYQVGDGTQTDHRTPTFVQYIVLPSLAPSLSVAPSLSPMSP